MKPYLKHHLIWISLLLILLWVWPSRAQQIPPTPEPLAIATIPSDGFNMKVVEQIDPHYVVTTLDPPVFNWFAGTFTNLPTDAEVTIGLCMNGMDTPPEKADVSKWVGLRPVMTYADPTQYESYEWFQKDEQGRWVSGDPFKRGDDRFAGTGKVPQQSVIPAELAEQFLSPDGKYWQSWREIETTEVLTQANIFRIKFRFARPTATVAMRVPFTYTYLQGVIRHLEEAKLPGIFIDEIGRTIEGRKLQVIRIDDSNDPIPLQIKKTRSAPDQEVEYNPSLKRRDMTAPQQLHGQRVILIYAREHATEQASSWVLMGMIKTLLADREIQTQIPKDITWLIVPILDPDGSAHSGFSWLTSHFFYHQNDLQYEYYTPIEAINYTRYLSTIANGGYSIVIAASFHNVECNEGLPVFSPWGINTETESVLYFNQEWFDSLHQLGVKVGQPIPIEQGKDYHRLFGWCWWQFTSLGLGYEVNDRYPDQRSNLKDVQLIGASFPISVATFFRNETGQKRMEYTVQREKHRLVEKKERGSSDEEMLYNLFIHGIE